MSNSNSLLNNRSQFTARQSMDSLIAYSRDQDLKIFGRQKRFSYGKAAAILSLFVLPVAYVSYSLTIGNWRRIYSSSFVTTPIEAVSGNLREYFVPEMYLKEREVRKLEINQLGLGRKNL